MADIVNNPQENIYLAAGDSVFLTKKPQSYVMLGASFKSAEIPFGLEHISLAQAVGRVGGLNDIRADASGVFVFRYEDPAVVALLRPDLAEHYAGSRGVPIVYRADLRVPDTLFSISAFEIRNRDLIYIANADSVQLLKFLQIVGTGLGITRGLEGGLISAPKLSD
jgi:polysaccharide export outer membrane protein